jgi:transketolase
MKEIMNAVMYNGTNELDKKMKSYGNSLSSLGEKHEDVVCLTADLTSILEVDIFRDHFPKRFFPMGMAEQNMIGVAAGLAQENQVPFASTFACFLTRRGYDQIVNSIAYPQLNVKLTGLMPGISSVGGASHQAIDDIAIMRAAPNMRIIDLADATESAIAPQLAYETQGPVYIRLRRGLLPVLFDPKQYKLEWGQSYLLRKGTDVCIVTSGLMTENALAAAMILEKNGVSASVLHVPSIKPIDEEGIVEAAASCRAVLTLDNHSIIGGLGSAVAEVLMDHKVSRPFKRLGIPDQYGKAASMAYLSRLFELDPDQIAHNAVALLEGNKKITVSANWDHGGEKTTGWEMEWKN